MLVNNTSDFTQVNLCKCWKTNPCIKSTQKENKGTQTDNNFTEYTQKKLPEKTPDKEKGTQGPDLGNDEEEKKKRDDKEKLKQQQKEEKRQKYLKEQAQKENKQAQKAKQAEQNPYSVFLPKGTLP